MRNLFTVLVVFLGVNFSLAACGWSPILNHTDPVRTLQAPNQSAITVPGESDGGLDCDFYFKTQNLCASLDWIKTPSSDEAGSFKLYFWDKNQGTAQQPVFLNPDGQVLVKLFMPSMGHGSSPVSVTQAQTASGDPFEGVFDVKNVFFVMPGAWEIRILFKATNGQLSDQASFPYQVN
jgi:hypothetical protein